MPLWKEIFESASSAVCRIVYLEEFTVSDHRTVGITESGELIQKESGSGGRGRGRGVTLLGLALSKIDLLSIQRKYFMTLT